MELAEFVHWMRTLLGTRPPAKKGAWIVDGQPWAPPPNGRLRLLLEAEVCGPSADELCADAGVDALLKEVRVLPAAYT
jgi:hypothetical protein